MTERALRISMEQHTNLLSELTDIVRATQTVKLSFTQLLDVFRTFYNLENIDSLPTNLLERSGNETAAGEILVLNIGDPQRGMQHIILRHGDNFTDHDISQPRGAVAQAVLRGPTIVTPYRNDGCRLFALILNDAALFTMVAVGVDNGGFIATAFPLGSKGIEGLRKKYSIIFPDNDSLAEDLKKALVKEPAPLNRYQEEKLQRKKRWESSSTRSKSVKCTDVELREDVWKLELGHDIVQFSERGSRKFECLPSSCLTDEVATELIEEIQILECDFTRYSGNNGEGSNSLCLMHLRLFALGYRIWRATGCKVYVVYKDRMVVARGTSLRLARDVILSDFAMDKTISTTEMRVDFDKLDLSSDHPVSSSPTKALDSSKNLI